MKKIGIYGATSYTGLELISLLQNHPGAEIQFAASFSMAGSILSDEFPKMPPLPLCPPEEAGLSNTDLVFLCLPHGQAAETAIKSLDAGCRVIDLSADFRLRDAAVYSHWYKVKHPDPAMLQSACYGLTEINRAELAGAALVANPGCYPTTVLLGLYPLAHAGLLDNQVIIDSKSGVSGAGRKPKEITHFVSVNGNLTPYAVGKSHRHLPEMEQFLDGWSSSHTDLIFTPHLLPVSRGILSTMYVHLNQPKKLQEIHDLYAEAYEGEAFIQLLPSGRPATLAHVVHTNMCTIGMDMAGDTLILTSAIDNLLKGASGQAVQNMNVMYGWEETTGLVSTGAAHAGD